MLLSEAHLSSLEKLVISRLREKCDITVGARLGRVASTSEGPERGGPRGYLFSMIIQWKHMHMTHCVLIFDPFLFSQSQGIPQAAPLATEDFLMARRTKSSRMLSKCSDALSQDQDR
jgi:hypothetical protein